MTEEPSDFVRRLPVGERLPFPAGGIPGWDTFPFETDGMRVVPLEEPVLPEPPRFGEDGPDGCQSCERPDESYLWTDEHWRLSAPADPAGLPAVVLLVPRGHHDLHDLPPERSAELWPVVQRVERAITGLGDIGRVHVNRWGDGGTHLHLFLMARPAGMRQFRGTLLPLWEDVLPRVPREEWEDNVRRIARAMAAGGGTAHL